MEFFEEHKTACIVVIVLVVVSILAVVGGVVSHLRRPLPSYEIIEPTYKDPIDAPVVPPSDQITIFDPPKNEPIIAPPILNPIPPDLPPIEIIEIFPPPSEPLLTYSYFTSMTDSTILYIDAEKQARYKPFSLSGTIPQSILFQVDADGVVRGGNGSDYLCGTGWYNMLVMKTAPSNTEYIVKYDAEQQLLVIQELAWLSYGLPYFPLITRRAEHTAVFQGQIDGNTEEGIVKYFKWMRQDIQLTARQYAAASKQEL